MTSANTYTMHDTLDCKLDIWLPCYVRQGLQSRCLWLRLSLCLFGKASRLLSEVYFYISLILILW